MLQSIHVYQNLIHLRLLRDSVTWTTCLSKIQQVLWIVYKYWENSIVWLFKVFAWDGWLLWHDTQSIKLTINERESISYVWLKDTQNEGPKLNEICNDPSSEFYKRNFAWGLICFTEKIRTKTTIGWYVYLILQYIMQSNIFTCSWIIQENKGYYRAWIHT